MTRKVIITKNALKSLEEIADYIEYKWSMKIKNEFLDKFERIVVLIQTNPVKFSKV